MTLTPERLTELAIKVRKYELVQSCEVQPLLDDVAALREGLREALDLADEVGSSGEGQTMEYLENVHARIAALRQLLEGK